MKSPCCTLQNYPNPNIHTVILSAAKDLHETALTFGMNSHCGTPYKNAKTSPHTVILSAAKDLHETALTFAMKLLGISHL